MRSVEFTDAAYVGAQVLRDSSTLSPPEAAFVFHELFELRVEEYEDADPDYQAAIQEVARYAAAPPPSDDAPPNPAFPRGMAELEELGNAMESRFHRVRGEVSLADLWLRSASVANTLVASGELSLILDKNAPDDDVCDTPNPTIVAAICERIAALGAAETSRETLAKYKAYCSAVSTADPASGVAAVRALRGIGIVSFSESLGLLTHVLGGLFLSEIACDRVCKYLESELVALAPIAARENDALSTVRAKAEVEVFTRRLHERTDVLMAMCLRRFGEHEAATLQMTRPEEFERLSNEMSVGAWDVRAE
ncbi:MAG: hypothetical protein ABI442_20300 [Gemmatimonadaceae bacterium]